MSEEPQVHQSFGSVLLSVLITLIIVGCAGFIFYSITKQQKPQQDAIQEKLDELKVEVGTNDELKEKIKALEEKIEGLEDTEEEEINPTDLIDTENWQSSSNEFFKISMKLPLNFELCVNDECENDIKDIEADYWKISNPESELGESLIIFPRINKLDELAIEFGQTTFEYNHELENTVDGSDAIGVFNEQLAYQFDIKDNFIERNVTLDDNYYLTNDEDANPTELRFTQTNRLIYFDYDGFIYRIMYPVNNPIFEKILEEIKLELPETEENEVE